MTFEGEFGLKIMKEKGYLRNKKKTWSKKFKIKLYPPDVIYNIEIHIKREMLSRLKLYHLNIIFIWNVVTQLCIHNPSLSAENVT